MFLPTNFSSTIIIIFFRNFTGKKKVFKIFLKGNFLQEFFKIFSKEIFTGNLKFTKIYYCLTLFIHTVANMNIFVLSLVIKHCAEYHNDIHLRKMIIEYAQLLSTAHRICNPNCPDSVYKMAHKNHPCAIWTRESSENYKWLYKLFKTLCEEFEYRFEKKHTTSKLLQVLEDVPENVPVGPRTPFALAMPTAYKYDKEDKNVGAVLSYRKYYIEDKQFFMRNGKKVPFSVWTKRQVPSWFVFKE